MNVINGELDVFSIVSFGEYKSVFRVEFVEVGVEFFVVGFWEFSIEGVESDIDGMLISFEFENFGYDFSSRCISYIRVCVDEVVEIFEVVFVKGVVDDFNVEFIKILVVKVVFEVGS